MYYDDGTNEEGIGLMAGTPIYWAIYIPAEDLAAYDTYRVTKVAMFDYEAHRGKVMIYQGDETTPENLLYTQDYTTTGCGQYIEIPLDEYVAIRNTRGLWFVMLSLTGTYPAPIGPNTGNQYGRLYSDNGTSWYDLANNGIDNSFNLRGYIEENNGVLGTMVFKNEICLTPKPIHNNVFIDEEAKDEYNYCIRKVYSFSANDPEKFAMSCPTCATITDVAESMENEITVYPNPVNGNLTIQAEGMTEVVICNMMGQIIGTFTCSDDQMIINTAQYEAGIYNATIRTANGTTSSRFTVLH